MSVAPVPGYGYITQSNAADIYKDKTTYDGLTPAQKHLVDRYVPQETRDEIDYDAGRGTQNAYEEGKGTIEDAEKAESHEGQGKNAAATSVGGTVFAAGAAILAKLCPKMSSTTAWTALACSIGSLACSIGSLICANKFDNGYKDRLDANSNAGSTNETLENHSAALESTMESMDEDVATYQEQQELLTNTTNNNASTGADLQAQIMDAESAGDGERVKSLKEQLKAVGDFDYSQMQGDLDETKAKLDEYNDCNAMAMGARDGGQSVADFLKEGKPLGIVAAVNTGLLTVATAYTAMSVAAAAGSAKSLIQIPVAAIAAATFGVSVGILGKATSVMGQKTSKEFECGSTGKDMQGFVDNLNNMIGEQQSYIDQTDEDFTASDEDAAETIAKGEEHAAQVVAKAAEMSAEEKTGDKVENNEGNGSPTNQNA